MADPVAVRHIFPSEGLAMQYTGDNWDEIVGWVKSRGGSAGTITKSAGSKRFVVDREGDNYHGIIKGVWVVGEVWYDDFLIFEVWSRKGFESTWEVVD